MTLYKKPQCPKCSVLEKKLVSKGVDFTVVEDEAATAEIGRREGILSAPILEVNGEYFDFSHAKAYIDTVIGGN